jgi:hypothetical protein
LELESLVVPDLNAAEEAGKLLQDFPRIWSLANLEQQRKLLVSMLDAVYVDTKNNLIVAVKPKPPFRPVFQVAVSREKSLVRIIKEHFEGSSFFLVETGESRTTPETILYFFLGHGPWTIYQIIAWRLAGLSAGYLSKFLINSMILVVFGIVWDYLYGCITNIWYWTPFIYPLTLKTLALTQINTLWFDTFHAISNVVFLAVLG